MAFKKILNKTIAILVISTFLFCPSLSALPLSNSSSARLAGTCLAPSLNLQSVDLQQALLRQNKRWVNTLDELKTLHPEVYDKVIEFRTLLAEIVPSIPEIELADRKGVNDVVVKEGMTFGDLKRQYQELNDMVEKVAVPKEIPPFSDEELSDDLLEQKQLSIEFIQNYINNNSQLTEKQKEILGRWASYSLLYQLAHVIDTSPAQERALLYARVRGGFKEIVGKVIQYYKMIQDGQVNPDGKLSLRLSPDDTTTKVEAELIKNPDGSYRKMVVPTFPLKSDPFHFGQIITMLNNLIACKADKYIILLDNFDPRKESLTSIILREIQVKIMVNLLNELFDNKEVVIYSPWMKDDHTFDRSGEHVLEEEGGLIDLNLQEKPDLLDFIVPSHGAGGDHARVLYPEEKEGAGIDSFGRFAWMVYALAQKHNLSSDSYWQEFTNWRSGEGSSDLLNRVVEFIIAGIPDMPKVEIVTEKQNLNVSSTDLRENYIWALVPYEIAKFLALIHGSRWENSEEVSENETKNQHIIAEQVIDYIRDSLNYMRGDLEAVQVRQILDLLKSARGLALEEIDRFISFNRDALMSLQMNNKNKGKIDLSKYEKSPFIFTWESNDVKRDIKRIEALRNLLSKYVDNLWEKHKNDSDFVLPTSTKYKIELAEEFGLRGVEKRTNEFPVNIIFSMEEFLKLKRRLNESNMLRVEMAI
ncbi:MAG: hypothetical protein ABIG64_02185 [Candidatus Omnitrophota bacterium]